MEINFGYSDKICINATLEHTLLSTFLFPIKILMPHLRWLDKPADLRERLNVTRRSKEAEKEEKPKAMDKMKNKEGQNIF